MKGPDFIAAQLALKAWQDGHEDGKDAILAVAFTIRNRVRAGWWNGDWIQVLSHHHEYSATKATPSPLLPDPRNPMFREILQEIDGIYNGTREDDITTTKDNVFSEPSPVPLFYGRIDRIDNPWFLENISRNPDRKRVAQVGLLFFWA